MKKNNLKIEFLFLLLIILAFIFIRSLHFKEYLNWSQDQAENAIAALKIYREKKLTLIGPQISATYEGRLLFQGPITIYLFLIFLLLGNWQPITASFLFMIFASLTTIPLYYGIKRLANKKIAFLMIILYSFLPYYVNYTRFLWNSTLQLTFLPFFIYFFSLYKKNPHLRNLFVVSFFLGLLTQFHYQFLLIVFLFFVYFFIIKKLSFSRLMIFFLGIALGLSPLILFELKHDFYNIKTAVLFLKNWEKVDKPGNFTMPHYYLSLSLLALILLLIRFKKTLAKISFKVILVVGIMFFTYAFLIYHKKPPQSFWAPGKFWNYPMEEKAYQIIKETAIKKDFNVADLSYYNTTAAVIKYLLKRDNYQINYDDYYQNRYLFVISHKDDYEKTLSYEVAFFKPRKMIKRWLLNDYYSLYLFQRQTQ